MRRCCEWQAQDNCNKDCYCQEGQQAIVDHCEYWQLLLDERNDELWNSSKQEYGKTKQHKSWPINGCDGDGSVQHRYDVGAFGWMIDESQQPGRISPLSLEYSTIWKLLRFLDVMKLNDFFWEWMICANHANDLGMGGSDCGGSVPILVLALDHEATMRAFSFFVPRCIKSELVNGSLHSLHSSRINVMLPRLAAFHKMSLTNFWQRRCRSA